MTEEQFTSTTAVQLMRRIKPKEVELKSYTFLEGLWVMWNETRMSVKKEGRKWTRKAREEERDEGDQNESGGERGSVWGDRWHSPRSWGVWWWTVRFLWVGTSRDILHSSCQWLNTYAAPISFLPNYSHTLIHVHWWSNLLMGLNACFFPPVNPWERKDSESWHWLKINCMLWYGVWVVEVVFTNGGVVCLSICLSVCVFFFLFVYSPAIKDHASIILI